VCLLAAGLLPLALSAPASASATSARAGYVVAESGSSSSARTTFVVPTATCTNGDYQVVGFRAVIRTSAPANNGAFIFVGCSGGVPFYGAQFQVNGVFTVPALPVSPGDRVQASVSVSASATSESMTNLTQGWTDSASGGGGTPVLTSVGAGGVSCTAGAPPCYPVPQFTPVPFSFSSIDGMNLTVAGAVSSDLTSGTGAIEATASKLIQTGRGFHVSYVSSCTPSPLTFRC
jgi:hypothetical protein